MPKERKSTPSRESSPKVAAGRRKLVDLDAETWMALDMLGRDTFMSFQELADEAFRDLLRKHNRPLELRDQLRQSAKAGRRTKEDGGQTKK